VCVCVCVCENRIYGSTYAIEQQGSCCAVRTDMPKFKILDNFRQALFASSNVRYNLGYYNTSIYIILIRFLYTNINI